MTIIVIIIIVTIIVIIIMAIIIIIIIIMAIIVIIICLVPSNLLSLQRNTTGTSGQPISDIERQRRDDVNSSTSSDVPVDSPSSACLDILEDTLRWGHIAPTCPGEEYASISNVKHRSGAN